MPTTNGVNGRSNIVDGIMSTKLLTVFGATGNQGGSVINTVSSHGMLAVKYHLRAVPRDVTCAPAKGLAESRCEVFQANMYDLVSLQAAVRARTLSSL